METVKHYTRQLLLLENMSEKLSCTGVQWQSQHLEERKNAKLFIYVQRDIEVIKKLGIKIAVFTPMFKNTLINKNDKDDWMRTYAQEEGQMSQPRKVLISSYTLQNGTLRTTLHLVYLHLGVVCTKT